MTDIAFIDTETTGLDPDLHEIWEVAAITNDAEFRWFLPVDLGRADPIALQIGGYYERHPQADDQVVLSETDFMRNFHEFATEFAGITRGCHLAGAVVSFDEERLRRLLRRNGACPGWHYHLIDVEALAVGCVAQHSRSGAWRSTRGSIPARRRPTSFRRACPGSRRSCRGCWALTPSSSTSTPRLAMHVGRRRCTRR